MPCLRHPPLHLLPLEADDRAARTRDPAPAGAAPPADAQPALPACRGQDRRLLARPPRARRIAAELRKERWGGLLVSHNGVWRCLRRHGLSTRQKRLSLVSGYATPYEPPREPEPERHVEADHPGGLVGIDSFYVGRLQGTKGAVWQLTAIDVCSSFAWAELVSCPRGNPTGEQASKLARRVASELREAGWRFERVLSDNGGEYRSHSFRQQLGELGTAHTFIRAGRPQTNGAVEALHRIILEECWRPAFARYLHVRFTGLKRDLARYLAYYNHERAHTGRLTRGASRLRSSTVPAR